MAKRVYWQKRIRKWHRYLGLVFGIQFLFWTLGGLYFSWSSIGSVRGDDVRNPIPLLNASDHVVAPTEALARIFREYPHAEMMDVQLMKDMRGRPVYLISFREHHTEHYVAADAVNGGILQPVNGDSAAQIALRSLKGTNHVVQVKLVTAVNGHHEYREKPLPAFAVAVGGDVNATVYVGQQTSLVHSVRNNTWRVFDFLWMLHIMDFKTRDDINNWLLRILSIAGLITLCSGYVLFFLSRSKRKPVVSS